MDYSVCKLEREFKQPTTVVCMCIQQMDWGVCVVHLKLVLSVVTASLPVSSATKRRQSALRTSDGYRTAVKPLALPFSRLYKPNSRERGAHNYNKH